MLDGQCFNCFAEMSDEIDSFNNPLRLMVVETAMHGVKGNSLIGHVYGNRVEEIRIRQWCPKCKSYGSRPLTREEMIAVVAMIESSKWPEEQQAQVFAVGGCIAEAIRNHRE